MKTIRGKIILYCGLCITFSVIFLALYSYNTYIQSIQEKNRKQMEVVVKSINVYCDQFFDELNIISLLTIQNGRVLDILSEPYCVPSNYTLSCINNETEMFNYLHELCKTKPLIESMLLYGDNGMNYYYHPYKTWNYQIEGRTEGWYHRAIEADGRWILTPIHEETQLFSMLYREIPPKVITFARLLKNPQTMEPVGVLAINIDSTFLNAISNITDVSGVINILDRDGNMIIDTPLNKEDDYISIRSASSKTGLTIQYSYLKSQLYTGIDHVRRNILFVCIGLLAVSFLFSTRISSSITQPISILKDKMKLVSKGKFEPILEKATSEEMKDMYLGFNTMVRKTETLVREIGLKEKQRVQTELYAIQVSINPHFIYNTLNCIRWSALMQKNQFIADKISSFIYLLRKSVGQKKEFITVKDELEFIREYAKLMEIRYENFSLEIVAPESVNNFLILPFLLQPLVENAIFHGTAPLQDRCGIITVKIERQGELLQAEIQDNGIGMESRQLQELYQDNGNGEKLLKIGVRSVKERIQLYYKEKGYFSVQSKPGKGTLIIIRWPIQQEKEE